MSATRLSRRSGLLGHLAAAALFVTAAAPPFVPGAGAPHSCSCCGDRCSCGADSSCGCRPRVESAGGAAAAPLALPVPLALVAPRVPPPPPSAVGPLVRVARRPVRRESPDVPPPRSQASPAA